MINAKLRHLRISSRKVRLVTDLIKGLSVKQARQQLRFSVKKVSEPILKLLNSAVANAQHNANLDENNLYISSILVDPGPTLKRWMPRAMGRATPIMKRTSHITLSLEEKVPSIPKKRAEKVAKKEEIKKEETKIDKATQLVGKVEKETKELPKDKSVPPPRPYPTTSRSKKRFFSRQTFGNAKKIFRRKSI